MIVKVNPCPAPRMTVSDRWKKRPCVMRYRQFRDDLFNGYQKHLPVPCKLTFVLPMPDSWPAKKKAAYSGKPHVQTPDLDNLAKAVFDALLKQDSHIWSFQAEKLWGYEGSITILPMEAN